MFYQTFKSADGIRSATLFSVFYGTVDGVTDFHKCPESECDGYALNLHYEDGMEIESTWSMSDSREHSIYHAELFCELREPEPVELGAHITATVGENFDEIPF